MEIRRSVRVPASADAVFAWVDDLAVYPRWMGLVHRVEPERVEPESPEAGPAWDVELQAKVGPLARSKRLRMVRTVRDAPHEVVFERAELDGRAHSPWVLRATLTPVAEIGDTSRTGAATDLTMELHYGGSLWSGAVLGRVLDEQVRRGSEALIDAVGAGSPPPADH